MTRWQKWVANNPEKYKLNRKKSNDSARAKRISRSCKLPPPRKSKYGLSGKFSARYSNLIFKCKRKNKAINISAEEYLAIVSKPCTYCSKSLINEGGISLDRIDNKNGYTTENVLPCCGECNMIRGSKLTVEEAKVVIQALKQFRAQAIGSV